MKWKMETAPTQNKKQPLIKLDHRFKKLSIRLNFN